MSATIRQSNPGAVSEVVARLEQAASKEIAVGFPQGKVDAYPETGESVAEVAATHVYGVDVPVRNFMGEAKDGLITMAKPHLRAVARAEIKGDAKGAQAMREAAGMAGASVVKSAIVDGVYDPIAEMTYQKRLEKGRDSRKPLIDSAHMVSSTTHVVRERGEK